MSATDTKPAQEPLLPCPFCGSTLAELAPVRDGVMTLCATCGASARAAFHGPNNDTSHRAIAAWNRRITRPPEPDEVAEAVKWAQEAALRHDIAAGLNTGNTDGHRTVVAHLRTLAAAAERAPTEAQVREIAEAWKMVRRETEFYRPDRELMDRVLAPIIGGDHD